MNGIHEKEVVSPVALYLRATADLVKALRAYQSRVTIHCEGKVADGRDMIELMSLYVTRGSKVRIEGKGEDAETCVEDLARRIGALKPK